MRRRVLVALTVTAVIAADAAAPKLLARHGGRPVPATPEQRAGWPLQTARKFFLAEVREKLGGDWAAAWRTLYPPHQGIASEVEFVSCERAEPFPAELRSLHIVRVRRALVRVAGMARRVRGVALDVHVELEGLVPRDPITFDHTFHLVPVNGHWTWVLSPSRYRLYARDGCDGLLAL